MPRDRLLIAVFRARSMWISLHGPHGRSRPFPKSCLCDQNRGHVPDLSRVVSATSRLPFICLDLPLSSLKTVAYRSLSGQTPDICPKLPGPGDCFLLIVIAKDQFRAFQRRYGANHLARQSGPGHCAFRRRASLLRIGGAYVRAFMVPRKTSLN